MQPQEVIADQIVIVQKTMGGLNEQNSLRGKHLRTV